MTHHSHFDLPRLPDAVVFDMDGLILDTEPLWMAAMIETMAEQGHHMTTAFYQTLLGTPWVEIRNRIVDQYGANLPIEAIRSAWTSRFITLCETRLTLKTGVTELLDLLDTLQIPAAIATSSPKNLAAEHITRLGLAHRFRHIVAQGDYQQGKPHPAPYLAAADKLDTLPANCLALEDSRNGVRSASAAGMMTIMVPDLVGPTDAIAALCLGVCPNLDTVRHKLAVTANNHSRYARRQ